MINKSNITIGSDPEFFVTKNGVAFPSTNVVEGDKDSPKDMGNGFAILKDNVLVEGNIPPSNSKAEFILYMQELKSIINSVLTVKGLALDSDDSKKYNPRYLDHPEAMTFGCSAYKNAWKKGFFRASDMADFDRRVAGFHIHIGYELLSKEVNKEVMSIAIARAYDYFVVYPARLHHNDEFRAKYYGEYGSYRDTAYGLECRALGGFFTADKYLGWVYDNTIKAIDFCSNINNVNALFKLNSPDIEGDAAYAKLGLNLEELKIK